MLFWNGREPVVTAPRENKKGVFDALCCNGLSRVDGLCAVVGFIREAGQQTKGSRTLWMGYPSYLELYGFLK